MFHILDHTENAWQPLPEIYAVELTSACDLQCPMCLRTTAMDRHPSLLDLRLLEKMIGRGEFAGTAYTELQQAGEPTIHPQLGRAVQMLQRDAGVMVGLSTHGLNMKKPGVADALLRLDALTISVDSVDPAVYAKMRVPATFGLFVENLRYFMERLIECRKTGECTTPLVEFQLVKTPLVAGSGDIDGLCRFIAAEGWEGQVQVRTNLDSFLEMDGRMIRGSLPRPKDNKICLNPFNSVSVNCRGEVLSCCLIFDPKKEEINYYGNLGEEALIDIWNGPRVAEMRRLHRSGALENAGQCASCYLWSQTQIHQQIVRSIVRERGRY